MVIGFDGIKIAKYLQEKTDDLNYSWENTVIDRIYASGAKPIGRNGVCGLVNKKQSTPINNLYNTHKHYLLRTAKQTKQTKHT